MSESTLLLGCRLLALHRTAYIAHLSYPASLSTMVQYDEGRGDAAAVRVLDFQDKKGYCP
jgi:hypothetical protein